MNGDRRARALPSLPSATLFVACALVALAGLVLAQMAMPVLGGSPYVVVATLAFLQVCVLVGALAARAAARRLDDRRQAALAAVLLALALPLLPFAISSARVPQATGTPVAWLFWTLALASAVPVTLVGAAVTLAHRWAAADAAASRSFPATAVGALGGLGALVAYLLLVGPAFGLEGQARLWTGGYVLLVALLFACAASRSRPSRSADGERARSDSPAGLERLRTVALGFAPAALLLGTIEYTTTRLPAAPAVWAVPVAVYLLGWGLALVVSRTPAARAAATRALPITILAVVATLLVVTATWPLWLLLAIQLVNLLVASALCHSQVTASARAAAVWIALGAAAAGLFVAVLAPFAFHSFAEYPIAVAALAAIRPAPENGGWEFHPLLDLGIPAATAVALLGLSRALHGWALRYSSTDQDVLVMAVFAVGALLALAVRRFPIRFGLVVAALLTVGTLPLGEVPAQLFGERTIYGQERVVADPFPAEHRLLGFGHTIGLQNTARGRLEPLGFEAKSGPLAEVFAAPAASAPDARVAVIGGGTGALACYERLGQRFTFFEQDPVAARIAADPRLFTYLRDCPGSRAVVPGDVRATLARAPEGSFDLIVVDDVNGGAVPISMFTREALDLYRSKLGPGGAIALNVTNPYLDLEPELASLARDAGLSCYARDYLPTLHELLAGALPSSWVVMSGSSGDLGRLRTSPGWQELLGSPGGGWTDAYQPLVSAIRAT